MLTKMKAQTQYKRKDGTIVPSVSTILNVLYKPALLDWVWQSWSEGLDYREVEYSADDIDILVQYLITCHLKGQMPNITGYLPVEVEKAKNSLMKYQQWERRHSVTPVMIEMPLVSEKFEFGGTLDLVVKLDDGFSLVDFQIGKAVSWETFYRLAAYWKLTVEQGWPLASARVLRIGIDESERFEERIKTSLDTEWQVFAHCFAIYRLQN